MRAPLDPASKRVFGVLGALGFWVLVVFDGAPWGLGF